MVNVDVLRQVPPVVLIVTADMDTVVFFHFPEDDVSEVAGTPVILQCVNVSPLSVNDDALIVAAVITKFVADWVTFIDPEFGNALSVLVPSFVIVI